MLTKEQICRKFLDNPKINPEKGTGLRRNYGPFNSYIKMCRELGYHDEVDEILGIKKEKKFLTGHSDVDLVLLQTIDNLNNVEINDYTRKILDDQEFWKRRLYQRLGLVTENPIDYKFVTKFLDNGKTFEENYQRAIVFNKQEVVNILLENNVILENKPDFLLEDLSIPVDDLGRYKHLPYDQFINEINGNFKNDEYFSEKIYESDTIIIEIPDYWSFSGYDDVENVKKYVFTREDGFSNGEILYAMAQRIPNEKEAAIIIDDWFKNHPEQVLNKVRESIEDVLFEEGEIEELDKYYSPNNVRKHIRNSKDFDDYVSEYEGRFNIGGFKTYQVYGTDTWISSLKYNESKGYYEIKFTED